MVTHKPTNVYVRLRTYLPDREGRYGLSLSLYIKDFVEKAGSAAYMSPPLFALTSVYRAQGARDLIMRCTPWRAPVHRAVDAVVSTGTPCGG